MPNNKLAIHGGIPVRATKMPKRVAFGEAEAKGLIAAIRHYRERDEDPPYQGAFEKSFCDRFVEFQGGGYADAVATGTAACYIALAALDIPKGSEVIISPVTDSGPLNGIIALGYVPVIADSAPDSYNMGVAQFLDRVGSKTKGLLAVHSAGEPLEIDRIVEEAHRRGIKVMEDCSQAPGARWKGQLVGTFGDSAAFSTMYRKTLQAGGSGGLVYCRDEETYHLALAHADRGKPVWRTDINLNNPGHALFLALNWNTNEFTCAVGIASLGRLQDTIDRRNTFMATLVRLLREQSNVCSPYNFHEGFSPFFFPIFVDTGKITCSKTEFAAAVLAEGIDL
ncbi:MAG: DegT/DnrJ/EryC1/StrS family aminotransferase, partial [Proteobacteria bacterium]|nr:DegT/DnrJ/EryC1/StrS family aminotransferase [Pseudomonadota bacterium]